MAAAHAPPSAPQRPVLNLWEPLAPGDAGELRFSVWLAGSILLAIFLIPGAWDVPVVAGGAAIEAAEGIFWFRWSRRRRATVGAEALVGEAAVVTDRCDPLGRVRIGGELWRARAANSAAIEPGSTVRVLAVEDLTLVVEPER